MSDDASSLQGLSEELHELSRSRAKRFRRNLTLLTIPLLSCLVLVGVASWEGAAIVRKDEALKTVIESLHVAQDSLRRLDSTITSKAAEARVVSVGGDLEFIGDHAGAVQYYSTMTSRLSSSAPIAGKLGYETYLLGVDRRDLPLKKKAVVLLKIAVELDSTRVPTHYALAQALWSTGDTTLSVAELRKAFDLFASQASAHKRIGVEYLCRLILGDDGFDRFARAGSYRELISDECHRTLRPLR